MNLRGLVAGVAVTAFLTVPVAADARVVNGNPHFINAYLPMRIAEQIGFTPVVGMQKLGTVSIRAGGNTYRGEWVNSLATRLSTTQALNEMRRYSANNPTFADRELTAAERRSFDVLLDLGRDADVLVVQAGNPACAGVSLAQARGIASGKITNWSAVGGSGPIALRDVVVRGTYEPRFGAAKKPAAAKGRADGGIADAAADASVAAITSWSRVRNRDDVCRVPIDGVAPTNVSVHSLGYKGAYPVTLVASKKRRKDALSKATLKAYVNFMKSTPATKSFRATGMLLTADDPSSEPAGGNDPTNGGRVQDQAGARAALEGERLQRATPDGYFTRIVFETGGIARIIEGDGSGGNCTATEGTWTLVDGTRYSENGGGYGAQIRTDFGGGPRDSFVDLPNQPGGTALYNGQEYQRSRSLPGTC